ncbi:MAG: hypothetical protein LLG04_13355 [Parachlamydia sp.]|nr:hypothetical protein [Parachlamydia sp.]
MADFIPKDFIHLVGDEARKKGVFDLIKGFLPFFGAARAKEQRSLVGRIHAQLRQDAHAMLLQLQTLKEDLRKQLDNHEDEQLWLSFEAVLNPLLREYHLIERQLNNPSEEQQKHEHNIKCVNDWIDRAKIWVSVCSKPANRESMIQAVIDNTHHLLDAILDRDLKMLQDYKEHELKLLGLGEEAYAVVRNHLDRDLSPYIHGLLQIKRDKKRIFELHKLMEWKLQADEERSHLFNAALQKIDSIVNKAMPFAPLEDDQEHLKDLINRVSYLENESQVLLAQLDNDEKPVLDTFKASITLFEEEVLQVHHDLRLTPELIDRVQCIIQELAILRGKLS